MEPAAAILSRCYTLSDQPPTPEPLIYQVIV
jgi:hypothetical protein